VTYDQIKSITFKNAVRCSDVKAVKKMLAEIQKAEAEGDSLGGVIEGHAWGLPAGLGEPYFDTLEGQLSKALFAIPAVKGVEFGAGFQVAGMKGSQNNDPLRVKNGKVVFETNNAGGILGGISNGMPLLLRVAIKPTPSIAQKQKSVDLLTHEEIELSVTGRHDVCLAPRVTVIVESMMAITLCDFGLRNGLIERIIK
jgi:chorismate synthase